MNSAYSTDTLALERAEGLFAGTSHSALNSSSYSCPCCGDDRVVRRGLRAHLAHQCPHHTAPIGAPASSPNGTTHTFMALARERFGPNTTVGSRTSSGRGGATGTGGEARSSGACSGRHDRLDLDDVVDLDQLDTCYGMADAADDTLARSENHTTSPAKSPSFGVPETLAHHFGHGVPLESCQATNVAIAREMATHHGYKEVFFNDASKLVSFESDSPGEDAVRINVYFAAMTVGVIVAHPRQGTIELFRRNVTNRQALEEVFLHPRVHTPLGYPRSREDDATLGSTLCSSTLGKPLSSTLGGSNPFGNAEGRSTFGSGRAPKKATTALDEESALRSQLETIDDEVNQLQVERRAVVELISVIDERHRRAREHEVRMTFEQERRGRLALWREIDTETAANQKFLDDELASRAELQLAVAREQLAKMTVAWEARGLRQTMHMPVKGNRAFIDDHWKERVKCVAIGATGGARPEHSVVIIYDHLLGEPEDGRVIYTAGVPQRLAASLGGRHRSLPPPTFVAMGTNGRFFVKFADGTAEWEGDAPHVRREHMSPYTPDGHTTDKFNEQIKTRASTAVAVAFGQDDAFFIIQSNGGFAHSGNIPDGLYRDIRRREHRGKDLADVNLGPRGEWWVSWTDGTWAVGGHSRRCRDDLEELAQDGWSAKEIVFGPGSDYLIRFS